MFRNSSTYEHGDTRLESNYGVSMTVPDMSLSLRDLINRHNAGGKVKVFDPVYTGENRLIPDNFERMDLIDKLSLAKEVGDFVKTSRGRLISARRAAEQASYDRQVIERHIAKQAKTSSGEDIVGS